MVWYHLPALDPPANISRSSTFPLEKKESCLSPLGRQDSIPVTQKTPSQRHPLNLIRLGLGSQHLRISLPPLSHPSNPIISFSAAVIRAYETSPRSRRKLVAEGRSWIPTLSLYPRSCPVCLPSQQERSSQATATHTSIARHTKCKCRPRFGAF